LTTGFLKKNAFSASSVGSAVFDAMFNSTWPTNSEEIPLPDVEPASFLALLKFLYSDEVQVSIDRHVSQKQGDRGSQFS
jgi:hypothetical protein